MKKLLTLFLLTILVTSCKENKKKSDIILPRSVGSTNKVLTVIKSYLWDGKVGDEIRNTFGEHQVGLPQPETILSMSQVDPEGFTKIMNNNRSIMLVNLGKEKAIEIKHNKYATPQTLIFVSAKDEEEAISLFKKRGEEITKIFKEQDIKFTQTRFASNKLDEQQFKTIKNLGVSMIIPKDYRFVKDSLGFLWLRQHLKSGIARGDGNNNILVYSYPIEDETKIADNITKKRDEIGEKHIPGSQEGMFMITEQAYTPFTYKTTLANKQTYETRGKWEVKNDYMAGPFLNYTILDKERNRVIVVEGFTYAPSVNKRDFIFELEAIAKSIKFNKNPL